VQSVNEDQKHKVIQFCKRGRCRYQDGRCTKQTRVWSNF